MAGKLAGLNVVKLLNEPTAAAIAFLHNDNKFYGYLLVFDFGGGTLDISTVEVYRTEIIIKGELSKFKVLSTSGDT